MDEQGQANQKQGGMDGGKQNERGQELDEGSGHGRQRVAGKQKPAEQATAGGHSLRTLRSAQAS